MVRTNENLCSRVLNEDRFEDCCPIVCDLDCAFASLWLQDLVHTLFKWLQRFNLHYSR